MIYDTKHLKSNTSFQPLILLLSGLLLSPVLNIPVIMPLRYVDLYIYCIFLVCLLWIKFPKKLVHIVIVPIFSICILIFLMLLLEMLYGYGDLTGILMGIRGGITILVAFAFSSILWKAQGEDSFALFFKVSIYCACMQGAVLWFSFFSPDIRDVMSWFFYRIDLPGRDHLVLLRVPGFVASGGDGLSLNHGLLCVVAVMGIFYLYPKSLKRTFLLSVMVFASMGNAFTGKSGLYLALFLIMVIICTFRDGILKLSNIFYFFLFFISFLFILYTLSTQIGTYGLRLRDIHGYEYPIVRLLDGFIEVAINGEYKDKTISTLLQKMLFLPQDPLRLLVGNNDFGQMPINFIESDIGYIKLIHGFGIIGLLIFLIGLFFFPLYIINRTKIEIKRFSPRHSKNITEVHFLIQLLLVICIFGLVAHVKIFYLTSRVFMFTFFVLLFLTYLKMGLIKKNHKEVRRLESKSW